MTNKIKMMKRSAIKNETPTFIPVLLLAVTLIAGAIFWIFFVGVMYFEYMWGPVQGTEGDWSLLNHYAFLVLTSPFVIVASFILAEWMVHGRQNRVLKLTTTIFVFLAYGGYYFAKLWNMYPPHQ